MSKRGLKLKKKEKDFHFLIEKSFSWHLDFGYNYTKSLKYISQGLFSILYLPHMGLYLGHKSCPIFFNEYKPI